MKKKVGKGNAIIRESQQQDDEPPFEDYPDTPEIRRICSKLRKEFASIIQYKSEIEQAKQHYNDVLTSDYAMRLNNVDISILRENEATKCFRKVDIINRNIFLVEQKIKNLKRQLVSLVPEIVPIEEDDEDDFEDDEEETLHPAAAVVVPNIRGYERERRERVPMSSNVEVVENEGRGLKHNKTNSWLNHVKEHKKRNPSKPYKQVLIDAKTTYGRGNAASVGESPQIRQLREYIRERKHRLTVIKRERKQAEWEQRESTLIENRIQWRNAMNTLRQLNGEEEAILRIIPELEEEIRRLQALPIQAEQIPQAEILVGDHTHTLSPAEAVYTNNPPATMAEAKADHEGRGLKRTASRWVMHVKAYAKTNGISYKEALKKAKGTYK